VSSTDTDPTSPPFSALLAFAGVHDLRPAELGAAIQRLDPNACITFWGGAGEPVQGARGILLSVNGLDMAIIHQRFPVPWAFDGGNQPNFCWHDAADELAHHKSHVFVAEAGRGKLSQSIARAGVVMLVAEAIASLNPIMGVRWEAARNLIRADHFSKQAAEFRTRAIVPVTLWIRLLSAYQPPAAAGVIGTFGLHSFGSPNVEIHARRLDFNETLAVALAFAQVGLESGGPTSDEAVTTIENLATFSIEQLANGLFDIGPVAKLTELESADAHEGWRAAAVPSVQPFRTAEDRVSAEDVPYNTLVLQVVGGIRNAFYKKPKDTWGAARLETTRQLDGFFAKMEARRAK